LSKRQLPTTVLFRTTPDDHHIRTSDFPSGKKKYGNKQTESGKEQGKPKQILILTKNNQEDAFATLIASFLARGPFLESPEKFSGPLKPFLDHLDLKNGEVHTPISSCMKGTFLHLWNM